LLLVTIVPGRTFAPGLLLAGLSLFLVFASACLGLIIPVVLALVLTIVLASAAATPSPTAATTTCLACDFDAGILASKQSKETILALFDHNDFDFVASGTKMKQRFADSFVDRRTLAYDRVVFFAHVV
jgi:hypothetical protein